MHSITNCTKGDYQIVACFIRVFCSKQLFATLDNSSDDSSDDDSDSSCSDSDTTEPSDEEDYCILVLL